MNIRQVELLTKYSQSRRI